MKDNDRFQVGTLVTPLEEGDLESKSVVKAAVSFLRGTRALYFSRAPLAGSYKHLGVYAYRREVLPIMRMVAWKAYSKLREAEKLEQLFLMELGYEFGVVVVNQSSVGIDTREDYNQFLSRVRNSDANNHRRNPSTV